MRHSIRCALLAAMLPLHAQAAVVVGLADIAIGTDDNLLSARDARPRTTEQFLQGGVGVSLSEPLGNGLTLKLTARTDGRLHARYDSLNEISSSGEAQLLLRPGSGFHTPTFGASMGLGGSLFNSDRRDGLEARLRLFVRQAVTTRVSTRGSVFALWRNSDSQAFDAEIQGAESALDWLASPALTVTLGYQYRDGEVVATANHRGRALTAGEVLEPDDAFPGLSALSFEAQTHIGVLGFNYGLSPALSVDVQARYIESDSGFDTRYHRFTTLTGLLFRF